MKKFLLALAAFSTMAFAADTYIGLNTSINQSFLDGERDWLNTSTGNETNYGYGVNVGTNLTTFEGVDVDVEARLSRASHVTTGAVFVKPSYDFSGTSVYALAGYTALDVSDVSGTDGFAYGVGVEKDLTERYALFVDYTVNPDIDDINSEVITLGVNYKF